MGGYPELSDPDVKSSVKFLTYLFEKVEVNNDRAIGKNVSIVNVIRVDCGAGVGRVCKELLCHIFKEVELYNRDYSYLDCSMVYKR